MLRSQPRRDGWELTLLDLDQKREAQLAAGGSRLSEPTVPSLEDLFLDLTAGTTPRSILPQPEGFES
jgi:hypothetical protein